MRPSSHEKSKVVTHAHHLRHLADEPQVWGKHAWSSYEKEICRPRILIFCGGLTYISPPQFEVAKVFIIVK